MNRQHLRSSYFKDPRYEPYRRPGNIKVPFWLQPDNYYAGGCMVSARYRPGRHRLTILVDNSLVVDIGVVQVLDDWLQARRLGLLFEGKLGAWKLLVTSIDLQGAADPVNRQLLSSLLTYIASPRFQPTVAVTAQQVRGLVK